MNIDNVTRAYIECALWSSTDYSDESGGVPLDSYLSADDLSDETAAECREVCADFVECNAELIDALPDWYDDEQLGHDLWLTRNRHGAGFWDRGLGDIGERLTEMAHPYGECWLYVGDDGRIYHA